MATPYETIIETLGFDHGLTSSWAGGSTALCPAHDDTRNSLSIGEGDDGRALVYCHAGCAVAEVVAALGLSMSDLFPVSGVRTNSSIPVAHYVYTDEGGRPLTRVTRYEPKGFSQDRWEDGGWKPGLEDVRRVLYRLPQMREAIDGDDTIYLTEGEKDAENIVNHTGECATTNLGGAQNWRDDFSAQLKGAHVVIVADNDDPGRKAATRKAEALASWAESVEIRLPRVGKDVTEHLLGGYGLADLLLVDGLAEFDEWDPWSYEAPDTEWLLDPFVPRGSRVLVHGPSGSLKTLWAQWFAVQVAYAGEKVAFISAEMPKTAMAKRFQRWQPRPRGLHVLGRITLGADLGTLVKLFEGFALIVIDSWSATQGDMSSNDNDAVARLDREWFIPLIASTGATIMMIDNTGHDVITAEGRVRRDTARGASRKRDIQEVELFFSRPFKDNNYVCDIAMTKMRLDRPIQATVRVETQQDDIDFYYVNEKGLRMGPMWQSVGADGQQKAQADERIAPAIVGSGQHGNPAKTVGMPDDDTAVPSEGEGMNPPRLPDPSPTVVESEATVSDPGQQAEPAPYLVEEGDTTGTPADESPSSTLSDEVREQLALAKIKRAFPGADI